MRIRFSNLGTRDSFIGRFISYYHNHLTPKMMTFRIRNSGEEESSFGLMIYRKKAAKEKDPISDQYIVFATNMKYSKARKLYRKIPLEYKKGRGIESGRSKRAGSGKAGKVQGTRV